MLAATALSVALGIDLKRFLAGMPVLTSISGVVAFRQAVARQMYGSLGVLLLGSLAVLAAAAGFAFRLASWNELPVLLTAVAVFAAAAFWSRRVERRAKSIPVIDDEIGRQRDAIVRVWATKPLPPWGRGATA